MRLFYFALRAEAQIFIEKLKAKEISQEPKIFISKDTLIVIGGIGEENLQKSLKSVFQNYKISKATNIGIAGTNSKNIRIGELFCVYPKKEIKLITRDTPTISTNIKEPTLFDMEGNYFLNFCKNRVNDIFIFKVVSDHLSNKVLPKEFVKELIKKNFDVIIKGIN